jgi:hypothetical protein
VSRQSGRHFRKKKNQLYPIDIKDEYDQHEDVMERIDGETMVLHGDLLERLEAVSGRLKS